MINLYDKESGKKLGQLNREQLQFLIDHLEEESSTDQDYYLNEATLEMLAGEGADKKLLDMLKLAMGSSDEAEIYWAEE